MKKKFSSNQKGFSLIEVSISLLLFNALLLGLFFLLDVSNRNVIIERQKAEIRSDSRVMLVNFVRDIQSADKVQVFASNGTITLVNDNGENKYMGNRLKLEINEEGVIKVVRYTVESNELRVEKHPKDDPGNTSNAVVAKVSGSDFSQVFKQDANWNIEVNLVYENNGHQQPLQTKVLRRIRKERSNYTTWNEYQALNP